MYITLFTPREQWYTYTVAPPHEAHLRSEVEVTPALFMAATAFTCNHLPPSNAAICCKRHPRVCSNKPRSPALRQPTADQEHERSRVRAILAQSTSRLLAMTTNGTSACYSLQEDPEMTIWGKCMYNTDSHVWRSESASVCSGHGVVFFGRCFCAPYFDGKQCELLARADKRAACAHRKSVDDTCLSHPEYGAAIVPARRWRQAQAAEQRAYRNVHIPKHMARRRQTTNASSPLPLFKAIPDGSLGRIVELGAGPLTQTFEILSAQPSLSAREVVLEDPVRTRHAHGPSGKPRPVPRRTA